MFTGTSTLVQLEFLSYLERYRLLHSLELKLNLIRSREADIADRFDKFSEEARTALTKAQEEALRLNHNFIGPEHLLAGLFNAGGTAARVLVDLGLDRKTIRQVVESVSPLRSGAVIGEIGLTRPAKKVIELSVDEARKRGHNYIGTEHLLLGLLRVASAEELVHGLGLDRDDVTERVETVLRSGGGEVVAPNRQGSPGLADEDALDTTPEAGQPITDSAISLMTTLTPKVTTDRWTDADALGYMPYARAVASLITHSETQPPLTIGITAPWGAGKTSVMRMIQGILDGGAPGLRDKEIGVSPHATNRWMLSQLDTDEALPYFIPVSQSDWGSQLEVPPRATVWFNAWKHQTSEQVWAGLAHCIISQVTARMKPAEREGFWLRVNATRIDTNKIRQELYHTVLSRVLSSMVAVVPFVLAVPILAFLLVTVGVMSVGNVLGVGGAALALTFVGGVVRALSAAGHVLALPVRGMFASLIRQPDYEGRLGFLYLVESDMSRVLDLVATERQPLVVFVDDLDRCAADRVTEVVEAINLFLSGDYPNCIFVLGMDASVVAASLEVSYKEITSKLQEFGADFDDVPMGWRFMEKVVQVPLVIPPPDAVRVAGYVSGLLGGTVGGKGGERADRIAAYEDQLSHATDVREVEELTDTLLKHASEVERAAIAEASQREYARKFTIEDPAVAHFVESAAPMLGGNPRRIKRFVNVLRLESTLRHSLSLVDREPRDGGAAPLPGDDVVAKFVTLGVRWPQAIYLLRRRVGAEHSRSLLEALEERAEELEDAPYPDVTERWDDWVASLGLGAHPWARSQEFRRFLAQGQRLSAFEGCGLW